MSRRLALIEAQRFALAHAQPDTSALLGRIRDLEAELARLRRQLEALGHAPAALAEHNQAEQARAERLRATIAAMLEADHGPKRGAAKRVLRPLLATDVGREQQPTLRCVQWHITQLRKAAALHGPQ